MVLKLYGHPIATSGQRVLTVLEELNVPHEMVTVHFDKKECTLDVRLTFSDDVQAVFSKFNACDNAFGEFSFKGELPVVKGS